VIDQVTDEIPGEKNQTNQCKQPKDHICPEVDIEECPCQSLHPEKMTGDGDDPRSHYHGKITGEEVFDRLNSFRYPSIQKQLLVLPTAPSQATIFHVR
jgi:hypothetical protein